MVFDVARALDVLGVRGIALELGEDCGERLAHEIGQHIEPAAMRHADDEFADAELGAATQDRFERRHQRFRALDAEAFGAGVASIEKALERLGRGQHPQDFLFRRVGQPRPIVEVFEFLLDPLPFGEHLDVHVFDADPAAISLAQDPDDLAQCRALAAEQVIDEDLAVEISLGKSPGVVVELVMRPALFQMQRIEIRFKMAAHPVGADQVQRADRIDRRLLHGRPVDRFRGRRSGFRGNERRQRPRPGRAVALGADGRRVIRHIGKKPAPARIDRVGVVEIARIELGDEFGVRAGQKGRSVQFGHRQSLGAAPASSRARLTIR